MIRIDEEDHVDRPKLITDDRASPVQTTPKHSNDSINARKDRSKHAITPRTTSLPPQHSPPSTLENESKPRRRYASDSNSDTTKSTATALVTSFLQYLRHELKTTASEKRNDYHRHRRKKSSEQIKSLSKAMATNSANASLSETTEKNEILTLIDLLVLRVECLTNEKKDKTIDDIRPTVAEVDQNLIEYLYYLFTKFLHEESNASSEQEISVIDKTNFVHVCQTLVRSGCFDLSSTTVPNSPDQSSSDATSSSDPTLTEQLVMREYDPEADDKSIDNEPSSLRTVDDQDTWLVVDLADSQSEDEIPISDTMCLFPSSTFDEQLQLTTDNYRSCESESSYSIYLSPNSSFDNIQTMVQEYDDLPSTPNTPSSEERGSSTNVNSDSKTIVAIDDAFNDKVSSFSMTNNDICTRLTNDQNSIETSEQLTSNPSDRMSRREKKMHERWLTSSKADSPTSEASTKKLLLGVEFPPIAVLRRKFSSKTNGPPPAVAVAVNEKINTLPTTIQMDTTNPEQTVELPTTDDSPSVNIVPDKSHDDGQQPPLPVVIASETIFVSDNDNGDDVTMRGKQGLLLANIEHQLETISNTHHVENNDQLTTDESSSSQTPPPNPSSVSDSLISPSSSSSSSVSSSSSASISSSASSTTTTHENKPIEPLPNEEKEKDEEQRCDEHYTIDDGEEEKNNSSFIQDDYHAPEIILINVEPAQAALLQQEKKEEGGGEEEQEEEERERPSSPLPTLEQSNHQRAQDESPVQTLSNDLKPTIMADLPGDEQIYQKVEIEEVLDDDDEEEAVATQNTASVEPTDYIYTDDAPRREAKSTPNVNLVPVSNGLGKFDPVFSCYEKALARVVDTLDESSTGLCNDPQLSSATTTSTTMTNSQSAENDPIALRALQRFEERMSAATAKTNKEEKNSFTSKGKSSWSGSLSTPRKSLENLFKSTETSSRAPAVPTAEETKNALTLSPSDGYIRPRKTFDDTYFNYGKTINLLDSNSSVEQTSRDDQALSDEQQAQRRTIVDHDDKRVADNETNSITVIDSTEQNTLTIDPMMSSSRAADDEVDNGSLVTLRSQERSTIETSSNSTDAFSSSNNDQSSLMPYRLQLEGRRRLNTLERMRERRQSRESLDTIDQPKPVVSVPSNDNAIKSEDIQDPIIRRALERFDEKSRSLSQSKSVNYDDIQDPITRRALMRLETNLKRTVPSVPSNSSDTFYTNNYTLGALQTSSDRPSRSSEIAHLPPSNNKTTYDSVHQRYCTPASTDSTELSTSTSNEESMRLSTQPMQELATQQQQQPLSYRQRSRSEDMLSSRELTIGQTTDLDYSDSTNNNNTSSNSVQLQRNRSSHQIALNETGFQFPNALIKTLEPNFVRTTESTVTYATPTQTYSAYSCEYTRPRRNLLTSASGTALPSSKPEPSALPPPAPKSNQLDYDLQRPTSYRPAVENPYPTSSSSSSSSSAFAPVRPSATATTTTHNYYTQPTPSYTTAYTANNPSTEDPIVRRALERFNSQVQNSLMTSSQYQPQSNAYIRQGNAYDPWPNANRPSAMTTSSNSVVGYQSIIGRRRQTRYDDPNQAFKDNLSIGDGYSASVFGNAPDPIAHHYMNMPDEPPAIPPRYRRDLYRTEDTGDSYRRHSVEDYLSENTNNNNNNSSSSGNAYQQESYIHHAYPATITNATSFRPINIHYNQQYEPYHQYSHEQEDFRDRAQSATSSNSSESAKPVSARPNQLRLASNNQQRYPPSAISTRTTMHSNGNKSSDQRHTSKLSPETPQEPSDPTTPNHGNTPSDSVFHRLAYTGTKASLSKSNSNSCSNLLNKNGQSIPTTQLKSCEIDFDDSFSPAPTATTMDNGSDNKYQRSKSVDSRTRLRMAQARANQQQTSMDVDPEESYLSTYDDQQRTVPLSKFAPINSRHEVSARAPVTPSNASRDAYTKRSSSGNLLASSKSGNGFRARGSNGNLFDSDHQAPEYENDENLSYQPDSYQTKLNDNRTRTSVPIHRYPQNNLQSSASTSSVSSTLSRTKPPVTIPITIDRRDSNTSSSETNRGPKRSDDNRVLSPPGQRRNIPVSVFTPAKLDNKRPAPAPPAFNYESQQHALYSARPPPADHEYTTEAYDDDNRHRKMSSTNSNGSKTPTGLHTNEYSLSAEKHDHGKKMNVFERLFRGNKKKSAN